MVSVALFEQTYGTPAENLACDETLLELAEAGQGPAILRFWESAQPFVALGYANRLEEEVNVAACQEQGIPILRRCSGGGTVLQGPGCLSYALVLPCDVTGPLGSISAANHFIMQRHRHALTGLLRRDVSVAGVTDLALGSLKFSGNAQRRRRQWLLFHGTFLYAFDLELIGQVLRLPARQPDYRQGRSHAEFLTQLPVGRQAIQRALSEVWETTGPAVPVPLERIQSMVRERYGNPQWIENRQSASCPCIPKLTDRGPATRGTASPSKGQRAWE